LHKHFVQNLGVRVAIFFNDFLQNFRGYFLDFLLVFYF
jgi:hypothetical protein